MGVRNRERAFVRRRELIKRLGGKCANCGTKGSERNGLEVDHINGRSYDVRKMDASWRIAKYEQEERDGIPLQVLCKRCNANAHKGEW
jgi:5-methylcytosine-specific restriction endonuclease McrA